MSALWGGRDVEATGPAIMQSLDSLSIINRDHSNNGPFAIHESSSPHGLHAKCQFNAPKSCLLFDGDGNLRITDSEQFLAKLNCTDKNQRVKVVSIFGNTGDGKSHTLNQTFFKGYEVFKTSNEQNSCTVGVWAAFDHVLKVICLDTEGTTTCEKDRSKLLLKIFALSDIVIYRTRSEKLNRDLFTFLGTAGRSFSSHLQTALQSMARGDRILNSLNMFGQSVIILHETRHTKPLTNSSSESGSAEDILKNRFAQMGFKVDAFNSIKYVGLQTVEPPTDYELLRFAVRHELDNAAVRSSRSPVIVYNMLKFLNDKLLSELSNLSNDIDQYFSCPVKCLSCGSRCTNTAGHARNEKTHSNTSRCCYQNQYENLKYICKKCYNHGNEVEVTSRFQTKSDTSWYGFAKYAWSGYVIECPNCGEIYRSRQYWYGNKNPEDIAVRTEITHVWNVSNASMAPQNTAQRVIDGVSYISEAVSNVSLQSTKVLSAWVADQVAPAYWRPNNEVKHCHKCKSLFGPTDTKHHCRACGEGFCAQCSSHTKCVPSRNWHTPVRVCDLCYDRDANSNEQPAEISEDVSARKVTEQVVSTLSAVGTVLSYSKSFIKDTVRPAYWVPDAKVMSCCVCDQKFSDTVPLHHCRDCGQGVCQDCSRHSKPVPHRGWNKPVRVCNSCIKID